MLKIATGVSMCETNKRQIRFLPFIVAVLTFVRVTVGKSSIKRIIIETKVSQHSLSLSDQLHMNARKQPSSPPWEAGLQHFSSSLSPSFQLSPPPPVRNRAVNLLRLTPGFVTDVYLVCKKCFYVVSKYVWAQRVMMLLYCQGGKQCSKGASADPQTPYAHSLSFFHSQGSLPRPLPLYTTTCMDKHLPAYKHALFSLTNRHSYAWGHTHAHAWTLLSHHHPRGPFGFCLCLMSVGSAGHSSAGAAQPGGIDQDLTRCPTLDISVEELCCIQTALATNLQQQIGLGEKIIVIDFLKHNKEYYITLSFISVI